MKKVLCALLLVPIVLSVGYWAIGFVTGLIAGEISLMAWVVEHKIILTFILCFILLGFIGPFKDD